MDLDHSTYSVDDDPGDEPTVDLGTMMQDEPFVAGENSAGYDSVEADENQQGAEEEAGNEEDAVITPAFTELSRGKCESVLLAEWCPNMDLVAFVTIRRSASDTLTGNKKGINGKARDLRKVDQGYIQSWMQYQWWNKCEIADDHGQERRLQSEGMSNFEPHNLEDCEYVLSIRRLSLEVLMTVKVDEVGEACGYNSGEDDSEGLTANAKYKGGEGEEDHGSANDNKCPECQGDGCDICYWTGEDIDKRQEKEQGDALADSNSDATRTAKSERPPLTTCPLVTCISWRGDGRVVALGLRTGAVILYGLDAAGPQGDQHGGEHSAGPLLWTQVLNVPVCSVDWSAGSPHPPVLPLNLLLEMQSVYKIHKETENDNGPNSNVNNSYNNNQLLSSIATALQTPLPSIHSLPLVQSLPPLPPLPPNPSVSSVAATMSLIPQLNLPSLAIGSTSGLLSSTCSNFISRSTSHGSSSTSTTQDNPLAITTSFASLLSSPSSTSAGPKGVLTTYPLPLLAVSDRRCRTKLLAGGFLSLGYFAPSPTLSYSLLQSQRFPSPTYPPGFTPPCTLRRLTLSRSLDALSFQVAPPFSPSTTLSHSFKLPLLSPLLPHFTRIALVVTRIVDVIHRISAASHALRARVHTAVRHVLNSDSLYRVLTQRSLFLTGHLLLFLPRLYNPFLLAS